MEKKTRAIPPGKEQGMTYYKPLTPEFRARINWQTGGTGGKMKEMTPEEAIEVLDNEYKRIELQIMSLKGTIKENTESFRYRIYVKENLKTAITALKEIQQYREIGTVEQVRNQKHNLEMAYKIISDYEAIGTVEECREAVEKQKLKNPVKDKYHHNCCPNCGWNYEVDYDDYKHCPECGQRLDIGG